MCFSASASFTASGVLLVGAFASIKNIRTPDQVPFAFIPLFFSIQQFCEGVLWLSFRNAEYAVWQKDTAYAFLVFAQVLWPLWVPLSIFMLEKNPKNKKILSVLVVMGTCVSTYIAYCMYNYPMQASIDGHHIRYDVGFPHNMVYIDELFYFMAIVIPAFVSSVKRMIYIGALILISFTITKIFLEEYIVSVWCFFAAPISLFAFIILKDSRKKIPENKLILTDK